MADRDAIEQEKRAHDEFSAGFSSDSPPEGETKPPVAAVPEPAPEAVPMPQPAAPAAGESKATGPQIVQITAEDYKLLKDAAGKTVALEQQLSKAFGTMGSMQQVINQIRNSTPAGQSVELTREDLAELEKDYPELTASLLTGLQRALKKAGVRGTGPAERGVDPEEVRKAVLSDRTKAELEELSDIHPTWRDIVGAPNDASNGFRKWLSTQPEDYQERVNNTQSARITARAIDKYLAAEAAAKKAAEGARPAQTATSTRQIVARQDRIRSAIPPRGTGTAPAPATRTADDEFREGFASG